MQEVDLLPLCMAARGLPTNLMKLRQVFRVPFHLIVLLIINSITSMTTSPRTTATLLLKSVDILGPDAESAHVLVDLKSHLHLVVLDTTNDERLVESKVTLDARLFHHLLGHEGLLYVAILAVAFDHDTVGYEVGFASCTRIWLQHLLEDERCLWHIKAADAAVEQRVESDNIGCHIFVVLHLL